MRGLPDWFGIPSAIDEYRKALERLDTYVAFMDGRVAGFLALKPLTPASAEIHVMAVDPKYHRLGLGRALVEEAERWVLERSLEYLSVKTLGPSRDDLTTSKHASSTMRSALPRLKRRTFGEMRTPVSSW